jgi:hypothetical protein
MKRVLTFLFTFVTAFTVVQAIPASGSGQLPTPQTRCQGSDLSRYVTPGNILWHGTKWPVDDSNPDTHYFHWAMYVDIKVGRWGNWKRYHLEPTVINRWNDYCLAYSVEVNTPWHGENRASVKTYDADTGELAGQSVYRRLRAACHGCS